MKGEFADLHLLQGIQPENLFGGQDKMFVRKHCAIKLGLEATFIQ